MTSEKNLELIGRLAQEPDLGERLSRGEEILEFMDNHPEFFSQFSRLFNPEATVRQGPPRGAKPQAVRQPRAAAQPAAEESSEVTDAQLIEFLDNNSSAAFHKLAEIAAHFKIERKTSIKPNLERLASQEKIVAKPPLGYRSVNFKSTKGRKPTLTAIEGGQKEDGRKGNPWGAGGKPKNEAEALERKEAIKNNPKLSDTEKKSRMGIVDDLISKYRTEGLTKTEETKKFNRKTAAAGKRQKARGTAGSRKSANG